MSELRKDEPFELRHSRTFRIILSTDEDGHSYYSCPHLVPRSYSVLIGRGRSGYEIIHALGKRERTEQLHDDVILLQLLQYTRILEFVVFLCKLRLLFFYTQRD